MNPKTEPVGAPPGVPEEAEKTPPKLEYHKAITMADVAKAAGVSQGAISSLLNDRDYGIRVSEKTRERVFKICRELGYMPNDLRAVVRMYPELGDLCLLLSKEIVDPMLVPRVSRAAAAIMRGIGEPSHHFVIAQYGPETDYAAQPEALPHPVRSGTASKFILIGAPNPSLLQILVRRNLAIIHLGQDVGIAGVTSIAPDYADASRQAIEYLFRLGHRQAAILSGPFGTTDPAIIELNRGVRLGYEAADAPIEAQNIVYGDLSYRSGCQAVEHLLSHAPPPTAIFCLNDALAEGAMARAQAMGLKVPDDLSVMGCSDDPTGESTYPSLTTIHLPVEEMGRAAVEEIVARIREPLPEEARRIILPARLVERASCAPPKARES